jgi:sugar phosphate isomerase/epimerase
MFKNLSTEALGISGQPNEFIELALSNGFKGIDLDLVAFEEQVKLTSLAHARRLIDSARLKIGSFRLPLSVGAEDAEYRPALEKVARLAELARALGCTRATTVIEPASDRRAYHDNFEFHRRRLAEIGGVLKPFGIRLGVEFLAPHHLRSDAAFSFIQTFDAALMLVRNTGADNVGLAFDAWHWRLGGGSLDQLRSLSGDKVVAVYLADAAAGTTAETAQDDSRRLPGETGVIDAAGILSVLAGIRYDGPVTPRPGKIPGASRDKAVKQAGAALDGVWKAAGLNVAGKLATAAK